MRIFSKKEALLSLVAILSLVVTLEIIFYIVFNFHSSGKRRYLTRKKATTVVGNNTSESKNFKKKPKNIEFSAISEVKGYALVLVGDLKDLLTKYSIYNYKKWSNFA